MSPGVTTTIARRAEHGSTEFNLNNDLNFVMDRMYRRQWLDRRAPYVPFVVSSASAPPRPLSLQQLWDQLPPDDYLSQNRTPSVDTRVNNEAYVQQVFGPAAHLLTVPVARWLAPHLPLEFPAALHALGWWSTLWGANATRLLRYEWASSRVWLTHWSEETLTMEMETYINNRRRILLLRVPTRFSGVEQQMLSIGRSGLGLMPVYLFFAVS